MSYQFEVVTLGRVRLVLVAESYVEGARIAREFAAQNPEQAIRRWRGKRGLSRVIVHCMTVLIRIDPDIEIPLDLREVYNRIYPTPAVGETHFEVQRRQGTGKWTCLGTVEEAV